MTTESKLKRLAKALADLGLKFPGLNFIQRDALSAGQSVRIHEVDRTPVVVDPDIGTGDGIKERCFDSRGLDVGGRDSTGSNGRTTWRLSDFICLAGRPRFSEPKSFVATAEASAAAIVMTTRTVSAGSDLVIDVFSWNIDGSPAPSVRFSFRCWTEDPIVIE